MKTFFILSFNIKMQIQRNLMWVIAPWRTIPHYIVFAHFLYLLYILAVFALFLVILVNMFEFVGRQDHRTNLKYIHNGCLWTSLVPVRSVVLELNIFVNVNRRGQWQQPKTTNDDDGPQWTEDAKFGKVLAFLYIYI